MKLFDEQGPISFDNTQEMSKLGTELRYCLDENIPQVDFHMHSFYEIYYYLGGPVDYYIIGGRTYNLRPGDVLLIPPCIPHRPIMNQKNIPYRRFVLWISCEQLKQYEQIDPELSKILHHQGHETFRIRCGNSPARHALENTLLMMWTEEKKPSICSRAHLLSLRLSFLVLLNRTATGENQHISTSPGKEGILEELMAYINDNYAESITLNSVADHFFTSPSNIEFMLTKHVGKPFYRYVTECRVLRAQELIASGMPLKDVGLTCGYNEYSSFYRAFRREVGESPTQYSMRACENFLPENGISPEK